MATEKKETLDGTYRPAAALCAYLLILVAATIKSADMVRTLCTLAASTASKAYMNLERRDAATGRRCGARRYAEV